MKYALQQLPDGTSRMVDATGKPLGNKDIDYPVLHVLPKLLVPEELIWRGKEGLRCDEIDLEVKSSSIDKEPGRFASIIGGESSWGIGADATNESSEPDEELEP